MRKILILMMAAVLMLSAAGGFAASSTEKKVPVLIGFKGTPDTGLIEGLGGIVGVKFEHMPVVAARLPPAVIDILRKNPKIDYIEEDAIAYAIPGVQQVQQAAQTTPWGVSKINATITGYDGSGVKVAILDTGIQYNHPDLKVAGGVDCAGFLWLCVSTSKYSWTDRNGHGTHVAGIVAALDNSYGVRGVAPKANIYAVKVLNDQGWGYYSDVIKGYEWAMDNGMRVASASLGGSSDSTSLHTAIQNAKNAGVTLVAAAGNSGDSGLTYPGKYPEVISVGATDINDNVASWSSKGQELVVVAPGVNIYSTYKGSSYATMSGTSMAAPHVTGTVAVMLQKNPSLTPDQVQTKLQNTAVDLYTAGRDDISGYGRIDAQKAVN